MAPPPRAPARLGPRLATIVLVLLALLAFLGTLAAADEGVLAARARYFDRFVAWQPVAGGFAVPLPGARLLMLALFVVLVLDRTAWNRGPGRRGLLLVHGGAALLLGSGLWSAWAGREATVTLGPGQAVHDVAAADLAVAVPFGLRLRAVHREYHPGTSLPARLEADLEVEPPGEPAYGARLTLHDALRRDGLSVHLRTDPAGMLPPRAPVELVFQRDPASGLRLAACALLAAGLLWHFAGALRRRVRAGEA
jgi:hypothetical protein